MLSFLPLAVNGDVRVSAAEDQGQIVAEEVITAPRLADAGHARLRYRALVIGINQYASQQDGLGWEPLVTARRDAAAVAHSLRDHFSFEVRTLLDRDASRMNIIRALDELVQLDSEDAVLVYYSGHGFYDAELGEGFWIPADARQAHQGRPAKEEWIWNSTITKIVGASRARHILVVADSCYSGSLFRGQEQIASKGRLKWYLRANGRPSRYLITSGNLEPVLDSGGRHSIFAQEFLNVLNYFEHDVFAASDLALAVRERVSAFTGQMVRMGPLAVSSHAGGEFVFVRRGASLLEASEPILRERPKQENTDGTMVEATPTPSRSSQDILQDAVWLNTRGASQSTRSVLRELRNSELGDDALLDMVTSYLEEEKKQARESRLDALVKQLDARKENGKMSPKDTKLAKPRILACIGPISQQGDIESDSLAMLYRICLATTLNRFPGTRVVDRDALESVLREMNLSTTGLSKESARLTIGELLPASLILFGELVPTRHGNTIYLRMVDAESTHLVDSFWIDVKEDDLVAEVCHDLAKKIAVQAAKAKPLRARISEERDGLLQVGVGRFHGVDVGAEFAILEGSHNEGDEQPFVSREKRIGTAVLVGLGDSTSELRARWEEDTEPSSWTDLWIEETY